MDWFVVFAHNEVIIEQHEHFSKGSFRNRCQIIAADGPQRLTIPLRKGKNEQQPIKDVKIAYDEPWQVRHWRSICTAYGNSPFLEHFTDKFRPFYLEKRFDFLWDWNMEMLVLTLRLLKLEKPWSLTAYYENNPTNAIDLLQMLDVKQAKNHDNQPFKYPQIFEDRLGFLPNPSILDLLFCVGKLSK
ncbi:MAG: WbqC family protein [Saprospiraceae bacterium]|nr:WbqC family protein [Saprospiraceae bacterium]